MLTKKDIIKIILYILTFFGIAGGLIWLIIEFVPYLIVFIAAPAWLAAALADGAKV